MDLIVRPIYAFIGRLLNDNRGDQLLVLKAVEHIDEKSSVYNHRCWTTLNKCNILFTDDDSSRSI